MIKTYHDRIEESTKLSIPGYIPPLPHRAGTFIPISSRKPAISALGTRD